jgi:hypothetical protein
MQRLVTGKKILETGRFDIGVEPELRVSLAGLIELQ